MTFLEAKKIVEGEGYRVVKNVDPETLRERIAREELEEAKRIAEAAGYTVINENDIDDTDTDEQDMTETKPTMEETCGGKKKKGKKGKKSGFVPFWAKKKDDKKIDEAFGDAEGTTFTSICEKYVKNSYFLTLSTQIGFKPAVEKLLDEVKKAIGSGISDKYYATFAARLNNMKNPMQVLYTITNAMLAGQGMDSAAGTSASAVARRRRGA